MKTTFNKSIRGGYVAESMTNTDANGNVWQITTIKNLRGEVACTAIQGKDNGNGLFSYDMFGAKRLNLASEKTKATEAAIKRVHEAGLIEFLKIQEANPETTKPAYIVGVGQILFTDWINGGDERKRVIYEVISPGNFKTVTLDGKELHRDDHVKPYSEKFGIGVYYNEGETLPLEEVNNLVNRARQATEERHESERKASQKAAEERARKIEEGKKIISAIPAGVKAVIIGQRFSTSFDPYADYNSFPETTEEIIYLAWSTHERDLFPEMRKAADKHEGTAHLGTDKGVFYAQLFNTSEKDFFVSGQHEFAKCSIRGGEKSPEFLTRKDCEQWIAAQPDPGKIQADTNELIGLEYQILEEKIEHREKYSMGSGYYLKGGNWKVRKSNLPSLETLQIAAAENRFFCNTQEEPTKEAPNFEKVEAEPGQVQIIEYSEKAIAVIGDTKPIKDILKSLGGKFNFRLTCGAGWIFPKSKLEAVQNALTPEQTEPATSQTLVLKDETGEEIARGSESEIVEDLNTIYHYEQQDNEEEPIKELDEQTREAIEADGYKIEPTPEPTKFCNPTPAPAFFRESGPRITPQVAADWSQHGNTGFKAGRTNTSLDAPQMFINF